ncbi:MAG: hypothetical protein RL235_856 [Chlamydiota bacterium]|jgi:16S rRNA (cytidine1402-2'-O)-methyltransferase
MLFIVATPIGNLSDISFRAVETLKSASRILCEDTRHSRILMQRYEIKTPLVSYHKFNEKKMLPKIIGWLEAGDNIALISDAGTPAINDPGLILMQGCIHHGIPFTAIPGACSPIQALLMSGFATTPFQYIGFLPKKGQKALKEALAYPGSTIALESPHRIIKTVNAIAKLSPNRQIAILREMTKTFEERLAGPAETIAAQLATRPALKGEIVLVITESTD